jgi:hypothetical protein
MSPINQVKSGVSTRWAAIGISKSRFAAAAMTALVAAGALPGVSLPAFAKDLPTAPACIVRGARGGNYVQIINKCSRPERVAIDVGLGPDTSCLTIPVGKSQWFRWELGGYRRAMICG